MSQRINEDCIESGHVQSISRLSGSLTRYLDRLIRSTRTNKADRCRKSIALQLVRRGSIYMPIPHLMRMAGIIGDEDTEIDVPSATCQLCADHTLHPTCNRSNEVWPASFLAIHARAPAFHIEASAANISLILPSLRICQYMCISNRTSARLNAGWLGMSVSLSPGRVTLADTNTSIDVVLFSYQLRLDFDSHVPILFIAA